MDGSIRLGRNQFIEKFGEREATDETKDLKIKNDKKVKLKTKAGMLETREVASIINVKLPRFAKLREFHIDKVDLCTKR